MGRPADAPGAAAAVRSRCGPISPPPRSTPPPPREFPMFLEITAAGTRGAHLVALSETLAGRRAGIRALRDAHLLAAPIPASRGGFGVPGIHALAAVVGRLARADARTAMEAEVDLVAALMTVRAWRRALRAGDGTRCAALEHEMRRVARQGATADLAPDAGDGALLEGAIAATLLDASISLGVAEA